MRYYEFVLNCQQLGKGLCQYISQQGGVTRLTYDSKENGQGIMSISGKIETTKRNDDTYELKYTIHNSYKYSLPVTYGNKHIGYKDVHMSDMMKSHLFLDSANIGEAYFTVIAGHAIQEKGTYELMAEVLKMNGSPESNIANVPLQFVRMSGKVEKSILLKTISHFYKDSTSNQTDIPDETIVTIDCSIAGQTCYNGNLELHLNQNYDIVGGLFFSPTPTPEHVEL